MSFQQQNLQQPGDKATYAPIGTATDSSRLTTGTVSDVITEPTFVGTATAKASEDDPCLVIQNDNTGKVMHLRSIR
ncbi:hypothetical protein BCR44DRAFT_1500380 [Catenaria anguillulae PL171]|uniref:Hypervirulence associated protein TUDOR domain-containing protein n=1 Tax=Catenaria anguillulae PL171 TaxID=765915 RepID=A0A1Y2HKZ0_9FUNG|nr:hypothetical protein BCR44DRAFT_1500380 [Catenaria anguillulae PL171]